MLNVVAPANFVLTLQSVPPFLVENILALALVVLLAVPLIAHIQILLDNATKTTMVTSTHRPYESSNHRQDAKARTVVMHYPVPVQLDTRSNSDVNIQLGSMRTTCSTPAVKPSAEKSPDQRTTDRPTNDDDRSKRILRELMLRRQKTCLPLKRSSSFLATDAQLPIIDISAFDYDAYRHKLVEMTLKRQYGDRQAPGDVVFNSIHLNSVGSSSHIQLSEKYSHSLFDLIEEFYDATKTPSRKEKEYLHPLDHFLTKTAEKPVTIETATETKESSNEMDQLPEMIAFREDSPIRTASLTSSGKRKIMTESSKHASKLTIRSRRSSSIPRNPSQAVVTSTPANWSSVERSSPIFPATQQLFNRVEKSSAVSVPTTQQLFNRAENIDQPVNRDSRVLQTISQDATEGRKILTSSRTSRSRTPRAPVTSVSQTRKIRQRTLEENCKKRDASMEPGKSSCESFAHGGIRHGEYSEAPSTDHEEKESVTCASSEIVSSSEAGSSCCSSRIREKRLRSRASSLSSRSRTIGSPNRIGEHWRAGNASEALDRHQETVKTTPTRKTRLTVRPKSTGGRFAWDVPDAPVQCDEPIDEKSATTFIIPERPRTASAAFNRRRTPEKGKISETVLPVLESVIDLRVDVNCEGLEDVDVGKEVDSRENAAGISKPREFKRVAGSSGKKWSSASFVKTPMGKSADATKSAAAPEKIFSEKSGSGKSATEKLASKKSAPEKSTPEKSASEKSASKKSTSKKSTSEKSAPEKSAPEKSAPVKSASEKSGLKTSNEVAIESSTGIKTPSSRPSSISRLPVHVAADKAKMRRFIEARQISAAKTATQPEKSSEPTGKKSPDVGGKSRRPRTAGCARSRTSALSPKIELSMESLPVVAGVTVEKLRIPQKKSSGIAIGAQ